MSFGEPLFLLLLLFVLALLSVLSVYVWLAVWRRRAATIFAGPQARNWRGRGIWRGAALVVAAGALLTLAAARPQWGHSEFASQRQGIDLVVALDISLSMLATDAEPNRLTLAQEEVTRLIKTEHRSRFGLVLFAGTAILRSPLTTDAQAIADLIQRSDGETGLIRVGSDLGAALAQAGSILSSSDNPGKAVLIVSDGEDHAGRFSSQIGQLSEDGIVVFTAGIGTAEGATIPDPEADTPGMVKLDAQGRPVVTTLDEQNLITIAEAGGGRYIRIIDVGDILSLREDLAGLEQAVLGEEIRNVPVERFQLFVAAAIALLMVSWFATASYSFGGWSRVGLGRTGTLSLVLAAFVGVSCASDSLRERNESANQLFEEGAYEGALEVYQGLIAERPDLAELSYNSGNALHRLGNYSRAISETQRALPPSETALGAKTFFALGNHYLAADNLELAYEAFRSALLLLPDDPDAKHNLEVTLLRLQQAEEASEQARDQETQDQESDADPGTPEPGQDNGDQQGQQNQDGGGDNQGPLTDPQGPSAGGDDPLDSGSPPSVARALEEALRGIDRTLTFEEALYILDLLQRQQAERIPQQGGAPAGPDY